jgi:hypothetical protein
VRPFDPSRFADPQARDAFLERLTAEGAVTEYLVQLKRADGRLCWVELTAHAERSGSIPDPHRRARPRRQRTKEARRPVA